MPRLTYKARRFKPDTLDVIAQANEILEDYAAQGFDLTLRQLYYQFVARALIPNTDRDYQRLGSIVNDARLAGLIDWDFIVDRTRSLRSVGHWGSPASIIRASASGFRTDKWATQPERVEVWIEKDALVGVIEGVCRDLDVPYLSCRGYVSQSEAWGAAQRLGRYLEAGQGIRILHLGDHDPSGIDMSRDIEERLFLFLANDYYRESPDDDPEGERAVAYVGERFHLDRLALNQDQVDQYDPPPNPAKVTDSRARAYIAEHGRQSWELDALEPTVLRDLIEAAVLDVRDEGLWDEAAMEEARHRRTLDQAALRWHDVERFLNGGQA